MAKICRACNKDKHDKSFENERVCKDCYKKLFKCRENYTIHNESSCNICGAKTKLIRDEVDDKIRGYLCKGCVKQFHKVELNVLANALKYYKGVL